MPPSRKTALRRPRCAFARPQIQRELQRPPHHRGRAFAFRPHYSLLVFRCRRDQQQFAPQTLPSAAVQRLISGMTRSETQARRNSRTSSPPSLNPCPRSSTATGISAAFSASSSSASRHLSHATSSGTPKRLAASVTSSTIDTARSPARTSSPRSCICTYSDPTPSAMPR